MFSNFYWIVFLSNFLGGPVEAPVMSVQQPEPLYQYQINGKPEPTTSIDPCSPFPECTL